MDEAGPTRSYRMPSPGGKRAIAGWAYNVHFLPTPAWVCHSPTAPLATAVSLEIIQFPHPVLRHKSRPLQRVDADLRRMVGEMFDLMYQARGIGLAANQVGLPYRLFVTNITADPEQREQERVFLNPVLSKPKGLAEAEEGCLSLPGLYAQVKRPERITIAAYNLAGEEVTLDLDDLPARVVQHETDHLDGVLFIDRLSESALAELREPLDEFVIEFQQRRQQGAIPDDQRIASQVKELERLRT